MRISDWSSDVCSSDLAGPGYPGDEGQRLGRPDDQAVAPGELRDLAGLLAEVFGGGDDEREDDERRGDDPQVPDVIADDVLQGEAEDADRHGADDHTPDEPVVRSPAGGVGEGSEEHKSDLPSVMTNSYAVFSLDKN